MSEINYELLNKSLKKFPWLEDEIFDGDLWREQLSEWIRAEGNVEVYKSWCKKRNMYPGVNYE